MINRLFYSWQSDINQNENRYFIRDCIKNAIDNNNFFFDEATRDFPGSPDIAKTIFSKIDLSTGFIADITFINSDISETRKCPNPNVTLELGYASNLLGWENIILIFNTAHGQLEDLPFDFRNRRVITYKYPNPDKTKAEIKLNLMNTIKSFIGSFDLRKLEDNHKIRRYFYDQNPRVKRIVQMKPKDWNTLLIFELLLKTIDDLKYEQYLVSKKMTFVEINKIPLENTVEWSGQVIRNYRNLFKSLKILILQEIKVIIDNEDAVQTLKWTEQIKLLFFKLMEFERRLLSSEIDPRGEVLRKPFIGITERALIVLAKFTAIFKNHQDPNLVLTSSDFDKLVNLKSLEGEIWKMGQIIINTKRK